MNLNARRKIIGITLMELMVASLILAIVVFAAGKVILTGNNGLSKTVNDNRYRDEVGVLAEYIKKYVVSGDTRFYGFTWNPTLPLGRLIIPRSNSLAFVHYDKTTTPAITAICTLPPTADQESSLRIVIDTNNSTYGYSSYRTSSENYFEVSSSGILSESFESADEVLQNPVAPTNPNEPSSGAPQTGQEGSNLWATGNIPLGTALEARAWALLAPPRATLWITRGLIKKIDPTWANTDEFPQECKDRLKNGSSGLYAVTLFPLSLNPLTAGASLNGSREPTASELPSIVGSFPKRVFQVSLRLLNPNASTANPVISAIELTPDLTPRNLPAVAQISGAQSLSIEAKYFLGMGTLGQGWFEYVNEGDQASLFCQNLTGTPCTKLPIPSVIPALIRSGDQPETLEKLNPNSFSLIKQENLSTLRFRITRQNASPTESPEVFDAQFP